MAKQNEQRPNQASIADLAARSVVVKVKSVKGTSDQVKFGSVTVAGTKPSGAVVKVNVIRSTEALQRIGQKFSKPGVNIRARKDVPRYFADESEPGVFVRILNGQTHKGKLIDGRFVAQKGSVAQIG